MQQQCNAMSPQCICIQLVKLDLSTECSKNYTQSQPRSDIFSDFEILDKKET